MSDEIAVSVNGVSKDFQLPHEKVDSIKSLFVNPFKKRGHAEVQHALKDISFEVKKGEFFGIVGRNGSGKSTLLKIIAGIYKPNKGSVQINGRLVPFIELGVGFNPELTGRENVFLNGALMGFSPKEIQAKYKSIVEFAELERFMDQKLKNYSSGMQVRLAFSVATVLAESDILLIDEVLAVGDADFQRKCFEYFKTLKKNKKTVIFVSHDMQAIREYCDRAVLIDESEIIKAGTSESVSKSYTKLFIDALVEKEESQEKDNKSSSKWGSGGVDMSNPISDKKVYYNDDSSIEISYCIKASEGFMGEIVPGFSLKNEAGQVVNGTNTKIINNSKVGIEIDDKNRNFIINWKFPNIYGQGKYTVDFAVLSGESGDTLQWWEDAMSFRMINSENTPFLISPPVKYNIKKL